MQKTGNSTYSFQPVFNEKLPTGQIQLQVSAAFRGLLRRVMSPAVQISVWATFTDLSNGFTLAYPRLPGAPVTIETGSDGSIDFDVTEGTGTQAFTAPAFTISIVGSNGKSTSLRLVFSEREIHLTFSLTAAPILLPP